MRIALCDDDIHQISHIRKILNEYRTPAGEILFFDIFNNAIDLISEMKSKKYDALLLDVIMPGFSGIDAARDIRLGNTDIPIVFLTTSPEFAVESYRVHAFDYLMKPINTGDLYRTLNRIFALKKGEEKDALTVTSTKGVDIIPFEQLECVEISNRMLYFYILDGTRKEVGGRLSDYEDILLKRTNFIKVHRSYIINMDNMKSYDKKFFISVTGKEIPVARTMAKEVQASYMGYLHAVVRRH